MLHLQPGLKRKHDYFTFCMNLYDVICTETYDISRSYENVHINLYELYKSATNLPICKIVINCHESVFHLSPLNSQSNI